MAVLAGAAVLAAQEGPAPGAFRFRAQEIAADFGIGYGLASGDVDGDGLADILAINATELACFRAPSWEKRVLLGPGSTIADNVALAPHDVDGDGRLDVALGAGWMGENTGTLQWVRQNAPGSSPPWEVHAISAEPTLHRIRWADVDGDGKAELVVAPLHGRGAKAPDFGGPAARVLVFRPPANPRRDRWPAEVAAEADHILHNFTAVNLDGDAQDEVVTASREGLFALERSRDGTWSRRLLGEGAPGEVKVGRVGGRRVAATVEPWHGTRLVAYVEQPGVWKRTVVDDALDQGHALGWADFDGDGDDEVVAGWRGGPHPGLAVYAIGADGGARARTVVDGGGMATEDLVTGDFNGDGRPDIVAAGRATRNVKVYWNETPRRR